MKKFLPSLGWRTISAHLALAMAALAVLTVSGLSQADAHVGQTQVTLATRPAAESRKALPAAFLREAQAPKSVSRRTPGSSDPPDALAGGESRNEGTGHFSKGRVAASTSPARSYFLAETTNNPRDPPSGIRP